MVEPKIRTLADLKGDTVRERLKSFLDILNEQIKYDVKIEGSCVPSDIQKDLSRKLGLLVLDEKIPSTCNNCGKLIYSDGIGHWFHIHNGVEECQLKAVPNSFAP